jgi:flagellar protein FlgJ
MVATVDYNNVYTDISSLNAIKATGREDTAAGLKKVAKQFESLFINMMLKTMRESNKVFSEGNYLSSNELEIHQQNFDNQLSLHLTSGKGIGLADTLYRQLMTQYELKPNSTEQSAPAFSVKTSAAAIKSPADYVGEVLPHAQKAAQELGVTPEFLIAQSALETGWGKRIAQDSRGASSHNLFGIKAGNSWSGPVATAKTLEFSDGAARQEQASFRKYDNFGDSFSDYVAFLKSNPRYQDALSKTSDPIEFGAALQEAGYATDPEYAKKIQAVMASPVFKQSMLTESS